MIEKLFTITKKDLRIETMRGRGPGGQNRNVRDTCVRITHLASGAVGYACDEREQLRNKRTAFRRMTNDWRFRKWIAAQIAQPEIEVNSTRRYTYKGDISLEKRKLDRE
jgi:protein subunit release factor A